MQALIKLGGVFLLLNYQSLRRANLANPLGVLGARGESFVEEL